MRADLNKQLCERERRDSWRKYKEVRHNKKYNDFGIEGENMPSFESTMHRYGRGETKDFNENLNPLYSQLRKAVGRPWAKFYSELCQNFDKRSVINQHILQHLYDRLEINVEWRDGELWANPKYYGKQILLRNSSCHYYVDPRDGIIKRNKGYATYRQQLRQRALEKQRQEALVVHRVDDDTLLRKVDGTWFVFEMKPLPAAHYVYDKPRPAKPGDAVLFYLRRRSLTWEHLNENQRRRFGVKRLVGESFYDTFERKLVNAAMSRERNPKYHATKRTASHEMLKKLGLI